MAVVAVAAFALLGYTYVGYPLLIAALARFRGRAPKARHGFCPEVSVLVPVYNGAEYIADKLWSIRRQTYPQDRIEILVYIDGCSDDSAAVARRVAAKLDNVVVIESAARTGKPTGLNAMAEKATGDVLVLTDVRQPLDLHAISHLVAALADPTVGCASGNLQLLGDTGPGVYWRYENWIRKNEGRFRGMVGATGPLYAVRKQLFRPLPEHVILDDVWLPMQARMEGHRTVFVPDAVANDRAFDDQREFARKARTLAGNYQLFKLMPRLLSPRRNPAFFETFSHKIMRLLGPWLLILLLATSLLGASMTASALLLTLTAGQVGFYAVAIAGTRIGRVGRTARSFVVMNLAALVGLLRFANDKQKVTW